MERKIVIKMLQMYATTDMSIKEVAVEYGITSYMFGKLRNQAVIESWVDLKLVNQMRVKARNNQCEKIGRGLRYTSSDKHYDMLLIQREIYSLNEKKAYIDMQIREFRDSYNIPDIMYHNLEMLMKEKEKIRRALENSRKELDKKG